MRIAVTGSIATDHLMVHAGRFMDHFIPEQMDRVSLSFLVDELEVRRGGVAANIAFGLGQLGMSPVLVGAVGVDFDDHRSWLEHHGVDTKSVHVSPTRHTARFVCTTDQTQNQIASFYAGAMVEARDIGLRTVADRVGTLDLVVVAPNDPEAMLQHTHECRELGVAFAADPSQQLASMSGSEVRGLVEGAEFLFTNDYESSLLVRSTEWSVPEVLDRVGWWITTHGADGVRINRRDCDSIKVPAAAADEAVDPTGVGDAFRAGFLWALYAKLSMTRAAQAGCTLAAIVLRTVGSQDYQLDRTTFSDQVAKAYGNDAAAAIESKLRITPIQRAVQEEEP